MPKKTPTAALNADLLTDEEQSQLADAGRIPERAATHLHQCRAYLDQAAAQLADAEVAADEAVSRGELPEDLAPLRQQLADAHADHRRAERGLTTARQLAEVRKAEILEPARARWAEAKVQALLAYAEATQLMLAADETLRDLDAVGRRLQAGLIDHPTGIRAALLAWQTRTSLRPPAPPPDLATVKLTLKNIAHDHLGAINPTEQQFRQRSLMRRLNNNSTAGVKGYMPGDTVSIDPALAKDVVAFGIAEAP